MNGLSKIRWCLFILLCSIGCKEDDFVTDGMQPVYISYDDYTQIKSESPLPFGELGKIVVSGNYVFINEKEKGIHVLDNTIPENPKQLYFWNIPGNQEFTIVQNTLYADNGKHLLVINITNYADLKFIKSIENQYEVIPKELFPSNYAGWFECYDPMKGILQGWREQKLINPLCETI